MKGWILKNFTRALPYIIILTAAILVYEWIRNFEKEEPAKTVAHHDLVLQKIEGLGKLELVKYQFKEITELEKLSKTYFNIPLGPDSKIALITTGEAAGCIDLTKISEKDIFIDEDAVIITLPKPELCYYKIDLKRSRIYSLQTNPFRDEKAFIEEAYRSAEEQIRKAALNSGILYQTEENAEKVLRPILEQVSGKNVYFRYSQNDEILVK